MRIYTKDNRQTNLLCQRLLLLPTDGRGLGSGLKDVELRVGRLLTHRPAFNFPQIRVKFDELVIEGALKNIEVFGLTQD